VGDSCHQHKWGFCLLILWSKWRWMVFGWDGVEQTWRRRYVQRIGYPSNCQLMDQHDLTKVFRFWNQLYLANLQHNSRLNLWSSRLWASAKMVTTDLPWIHVLCEGSLWVKQEPSSTVPRKLEKPPKMLEKNGFSPWFLVDGMAIY
jgi:hypothetical protein